MWSRSPPCGVVRDAVRGRDWQVAVEDGVFSLLEITVETGLRPPVGAGPPHPLGCPQRPLDDDQVGGSPPAEKPKYLTLDMI